MVQHKQRHGDGQAILGVARFVQVAGGTVHATQAEGLGKGTGGDAGGLVPHQLFTRELEQVRIALAGPAVPAFAFVAAAHLLRQNLVVESVDQFVIHQHVLPARLVLQLLHLTDQLLVGGEERQLGLPFAGHQAFADEDLARRGWVHFAEVGAPAAVDHDAVERGALQRHHFGRLLLPMRVEQLLFQQMAAHLLQPLRLDVGNATTEQARGLHQLGRHDPAPRALGQMRARMTEKLDAARAQVLAGRGLFLQLAAHVAQQAGQHGQVDLLIAGGCGVDLPLVLGHHRQQLAVDVAPFAHAADVDEVLPQQLLVLAVAELVLPVATTGVVDPLPQPEVAGELALLVVELGVGLIGLGLRFQRTVAHVLHGERRGDDQHLLQRLAGCGLQDHAAHARVQRQLGQFAANGGQFVLLVHRPEFGQQLVAVGNGAPGRRLDEGEVFHHTEVQRLHAQDDARQGAAQDFRRGETLAAGEVLLVVQADADAVGHSAAAAGALVGGGLTHRLDQQLLHLAPKTVALDARRACVNHVSDARHRERGLRHVGGQHDAPTAVVVEHAVLLGLRQAGEQRQHFGVARHRLVTQMFAQVVGGLADLALARQEDQDVPRSIALPQLIHRIGDGVVQVVFAALLERAPALLHRVGAARDHDDRRRPLAGCEVVGKALGVDGGRGDDDLQVGPARQDLLEVAEQEVDVETALVRLVDDEGVVGLQQRVGLRLGQQDAVGHELDRRVLAQAVVETHLVAHHLAQRRLQLLGNALGHAGSGNAARLGVADQAATLAGRVIAFASSEGQGDLGQLGGLARAGLAADDDDLVLLQRGHDFVAFGRHRQRFGELDFQGGGTQGRNMGENRQLSQS